MTYTRVATSSVVQLVEEYIRKELSDAAQYENSSPLDESGIWSLHLLASQIYTLGFNDGAHIEAERNRGVEQRARNKAANQ